ncbi:MAG: HlyD family secretion protein [Gemmatimonadaceae bacterium]
MKPGLTALLLTTACLWTAIACDRDSSQLRGTGTVEIVEIDVAPMLPARVLRILVEEGAHVDAGDTLALLTQTTLPSDIEGRRARVASAEAGVRDLVAGARRPEVARTQAELRAAEAEAVRTERELQRVNALVTGGAMSQRDLDAARTAASVAANRRDAAGAALQLMSQGSRPEQVRAARAEVDAARASLGAAEATASDLVLTAPVAGVVLGRHAEPGEVLAAGIPAITIGDVARPWVRVYVAAKNIADIQVGQEAVATLDGSGRMIPGRVIAVNDRAEFTPRAALTEEEREDLLFGVKVELSDTTGVVKPGLPATVTFVRTANP